MKTRAFQEEPYFKGNHCFGCAPDHPLELRIQSYWDDDESVCTWQPGKEHTAGWPGVMYGGTLASLIDCHCTCTAIAAENEGKPPGMESRWFASVSLKVEYLKPTLVNKPVNLRARFIERSGRKAILSCSVFSEGVKCVRGEVVAVKVPAQAGPAK